MVGVLGAQTAALKPNNTRSGETSRAHLCRCRCRHWPGDGTGPALALARCWHGTGTALARHWRRRWPGPFAPQPRGQRRHNTAPHSASSTIRSWRRSYRGRTRRRPPARRTQTLPQRRNRNGPLASSAAMAAVFPSGRAASQRQGRLALGCPRFRCQHAEIKRAWALGIACSSVACCQHHRRIVLCPAMPAGWHRAVLTV